MTRMCCVTEALPAQSWSMSLLPLPSTRDTWTVRESDPHTLLRVLTRSGYVVGTFHCAPRSPRWTMANQIELGPLVVFPSTAVEITPRGHRPLVANANYVMLYNPYQEYRRSLLDQRGDYSTFFGLSPSLLREVVLRSDPRVHDPDRMPFRMPRSPGGAQIELLHQALARHVRTCSTPDDLLVQEGIMELVSLCVRSAGRISQAQSATRRTTTTQRHQEASHRMERVLSLRFREAITVADIAQEVGLSPFHAARVFRRHAGVTLHAYRNHLRLCASLPLLASDLRLADIALDLGYSSHSHFTDVFRRAFGFPPSKLQGKLTGRKVREKRHYLQMVLSHQSSERK